MVQSFHSNSRGANKIASDKVENLFKNSSKEVISKIIERYYPDFRVCGYDETLQQLRNILQNMVN